MSFNNEKRYETSFVHLKFNNNSEWNRYGTYFFFLDEQTISRKSIKPFSPQQSVSASEREREREEWEEEDEAFNVKEDIPPIDEGQCNQQIHIETLKNEHPC